MKLIARSPFGAQGSTIPFIDRIRALWRFGLSWDRDMQAQQVLIQQLEDLLDNSYTLISNVPVPGFSIPVPLVLVSKTGVQTFCATAITGIFSYKNEQWYKLDEQKEQYRPSRPNIVRRTSIMSRAIIEYLKKKGIYVDEREPVLYFSKPGVHIDVDESQVNLVLSDGVNRLVGSFIGEDVALDAMEMQRITDILIKSESKSMAKKQELPSRSTLSGSVGIGDFRLQAWQWLILFVLAILMLITVIVTEVIILNAS
jgi:hypothetical protein